MVASASAMSPPPPRPWMARNAMSCSIEAEKPDSTEPTTKVRMAIWKIGRRP